MRKAEAVTDLADFLRARYTEQRSREEGKRRSRPSMFDGHSVEILYQDGVETLLVDDHPYPAEQYLAVATEPAPDPEVLADLDAKLAIVDDLLAEKHEVVDDCWYTCSAATVERDGGESCDDDRRDGPCDCGRDARVERRLRILAKPFSKHADYKAEWAPDA